MLIVFFTYVLTNRTTGLFRETAGLRIAADRQAEDMRDSLAIAAEAAGAARTSAEASLASERARFFIVIEKHNVFAVLEDFGRDREGDYLRPVTIDTPPAVTYRFRNYGRTPGIAYEIGIGMALSVEPPRPVYTVKPAGLMETMIGGGASTERADFAYGRALTAAEAAAVLANDERIWLFGRVSYADVFGAPQTHRFYFRSVIFEGECIFQPFDHEHHNQST